MTSFGALLGSIFGIYVIQYIRGEKNLRVGTYATSL
jgi:hypothetical protein